MMRRVFRRRSASVGHWSVFIMSVTLLVLWYSQFPSFGFCPVLDYFACFTDAFLQKRDKWNETYMLWKSNHWGIKTCKNYCSWCRIEQIDNNLRRCRIEFWPHWISTRGVLIQRAVLRIQRIFHVELRPPETGGHCITTPPTDKILTPVEMWPPGLDSTLNYDPRSWFHVECWPWVMIQH